MYYYPISPTNITPSLLIRESRQAGFLQKFEEGQLEKLAKTWKSDARFDKAEALGCGFITALVMVVAFSIIVAPTVTWIALQPFHSFTILALIEIASFCLGFGMGYLILYTAGQHAQEKWQKAEEATKAALIIEQYLGVTRDRPGS